MHVAFAFTHRDFCVMLGWPAPSLSIVQIIDRQVVRWIGCITIALSGFLNEMPENTCNKAAQWLVPLIL